MPDFTVRHVLRSRAQLGEAPVWSTKHQALIWLDIEKHKVNRFDPKSGVNKEWDFPVSPGCIVMRDDGTAVIAARDGYYNINLDTGVATKFFDAPFDPKTHRFNDGKCDRQGRLVVGSFAVEYLVNRIPDLAGYYSFDGKTAKQVLAGATVTNGTAFSPDGKTMYRAESLKREVYAYDYDVATGTPSRERIFVKIPDTLAHPDGAAIDTQGGYWSALSMGPKGSGIARFTPDGKLDLHIEVPPLIGTMVAFGGPNMSTLFLTSSDDPGINSGPRGDDAGDMWAVDVPFTGLEEPKFRS